MNEHTPAALLNRYDEAAARINACLTIAPNLTRVPLDWVNGTLLAYVQSLENFIDKECLFSYETFWPLHTRIVMTIIFSTLSLIGIVGNLLVILVVFRVRGMSTPTNCYLVSLAVSDTLFFIAAAPTEISFLHTPTNYYVFGQIGCAVFTYLPFLAINTSSLSITAFTIERYIGICHPMRARYMCTVKRARIIIACIWIFCLTYNSPWLYLATLKEISFIDISGYACHFKLERSNWSYKVIFLGDFAAFYFIPMCLYVILYTRIALTLKSSNLAVKQTPTTSVTSTSQKRVARGASHNSATLNVNCATTAGRDSDAELNRRFSTPEPSKGRYSLDSNGDSGHADRPPLRANSQYHHKVSLQIPSRSATPIIAVPTASVPRDTFVSGGRQTSSKGRHQVVKMLAVIVTVFAICWLPYRAMVMYNSFASSKWDPDWYIMLSKTMIFINCAINPICYNLMSGRFRNAFRQLLKSGGKIPYRNGTIRSSNNTVRTRMSTETKIYVSQYDMDLDDSCNPSESEKDTLLTSIKKATMKDLPSPLARLQDSEQSIQDVRTNDESHV